MGFSFDKTLKIKPKKTAPVYFFTNQQVSAPLSNYCICIAKNYRPRYAEEYKEVYIDPGVHDLAKYGEYRHKDKIIKMLDENTIPKNVWTSIDYSIAFARNEEDRKNFMKWTYENNLKYLDNPQYICAVQVSGSFSNFKKEYEKVKHIFYDRPEKMLAFGGEIIGTYHSSSFSRNFFSFLRSEAEHLHRIHFFGLSIALLDDLKRLLTQSHLKITIDSTKWRFANTKELLELNGGLRITTAEHIDAFYQSYMDQWKARLGNNFYH